MRSYSLEKITGGEGERESREGEGESERDRERAGAIERGRDKGLQRDIGERGKDREREREIVGEKREPARVHA